LLEVVDVEVDEIDAGLSLGVLSSAVPVTIPESGIADLSERETAPFSSRRQAGVALAGELIGQRDFLPVLVSENVGCKLAIAAMIAAGYLFEIENGFAEQLIDRARHVDDLRRDLAIPMR
jgi:hypothetical protein